MRNKTALAVAVLLILSAPVASAYVTKKPADQGGGACAADGSPCNVYCTNDDGSQGDLAGTMYWNGAVWTDGLKSSADMDTEAEKIVQANGTACH